jgi:hypothetical protein
MNDRLIGKYPEGSGRGLIKAISWNLPAGTKEAIRIFKQDSHCIGWYSNRTPREYGSTVLPLL